MKKDRNKPKTIINKEIEAEDWCFICKDGGDLMICEYGDCLKVYHSFCVKKSEYSGKTGDGWTCDRHSCSMCHKTPIYQCFCCPNAVCKNCVHPSEFVPVLSDGGLCSECLDLVLLAEEDEAYDSDGVMIDFKDRNTHEGLFKEYWEIIKVQVGLTIDEVHAAKDKVKKKKSSKRGPVSCKFRKYKDDDDYCVITESDEDESKPHKLLGKNGEEESKPHKTLGKRKMTKKLEFVGWASKPLIEFLKSIGKDTTESVSHYEVDSIIKSYIQEKKLIDPSRKYKVCCDERLFLLFRRRKLMKSRIFYLLESHLLDNLESSSENIDYNDDNGDEDDDSDVSDYKLGRKNNRDAFVAPKKQRSSSSDEQSEKKKVDVIYKESCFAAIISDNIKRVYLRRSLVEEFFNQPEKFEEKVVGSFIRIKANSADGLQRNSHQLMPVIGIEKSSTGEVFFKVSSMPESVNMHMLSDSDFTKEECEDLLEKIENGVLKKLTIVELQEKADSLHEDVTKHWIKRELILLENRIDYANEKGRRRELFDHIERKELLKKPSEQEKLLKNLPKVIPEVVEL